MLGSSREELVRDLREEDRSVNLERVQQQMINQSRGELAELICDWIQVFAAI